MPTTHNHSRDTAERLAASLTSLGYLPEAYVEEISQIVTEYVASEWQDKMCHHVDQEIAKYQSGVEHIARIDTSVTPDGNEARVIGYGEEFTINQPIVTTVEKLIAATLSVNAEPMYQKHLTAALESMRANRFIEAFNLLAPVVNYGIRPDSISDSPEVTMTQAAYMLLLIGREINNPQSAEEAGIFH